MAWIEVKDYHRGEGWAAGVNPAERATECCTLLEHGEILYFPQPPFVFPDEDRQFLISQKAADSRLHKNVSYRPQEDVLRGFSNGRASEERVHAIMRRYSERVTAFVSELLAPYRSGLVLDFASFRPLEEEGRDLPLHKKNDLLHVDAFPTRPTRGGRILRVFTNVHPARDRVWRVGERFPALAGRYARAAGLEGIAGNAAGRKVKHLLHAVGLPVAARSAYDDFMLRFHDWLKENRAFQQSPGQEQLEFPPLATWLVFTDGVPHAALAGQYAMEQTFIVKPDALAAPEVSPIRVLEELCGRKLA